MLKSNNGISRHNGELVDMGGPCRIMVGREVGNTNTKDLPPIDDKAAAKSLSLYQKPYELYQSIRQRFEERVPNLNLFCALRHEALLLYSFEYSTVSLYPCYWNYQSRRFRVKNSLDPIVVMRHLYHLVCCFSWDRDRFLVVIPSF